MFFTGFSTVVVIIFLSSPSLSSFVLGLSWSSESSSEICFEVLLSDRNLTSPYATLIERPFSCRRKTTVCSVVDKTVTHTHPSGSFFLKHFYNNRIAVPGARTLAVRSVCLRAVIKRLRDSVTSCDMYESII